MKTFYLTMANNCVATSMLSFFWHRSCRALHHLCGFCLMWILHNLLKMVCLSTAWEYLAVYWASLWLMWVSIVLTISVIFSSVWSCSARCIILMFMPYYHVKLCIVCCGFYELLFYLFSSIFLAQANTCLMVISLFPLAVFKSFMITFIISSMFILLISFSFNPLSFLCIFIHLT